MYSLLFLTATTPPNTVKEVEKARAATFVSGLPLSIREKTEFSKNADMYRAAHSELAARPSTTDSAVMQQRREEGLRLVQRIMQSVQGGLTPMGAARLHGFADAQKRSVVLIPIPAMHPHVARGWVDRLEEYLSVRPVHAQGMIPYSSLYTVVTGVDDDGIIYATGTTNAFSGCNCHSVSTYTLITLPSGHQAGDTDPGGHGEVAQTTASLAMSGSDFQVDGTINVNTTHNAYCPISYTQFVNNEQTAVTPPLKNIRAYYRCDQSGGQCTTNMGFRAHRRCNPGNVCDLLLSVQNNWLYTLQTVAQISINGGLTCAAEKSTAQQQTSCHSPDPVP